MRQTPLAYTCAVQKLADPQAVSEGSASSRDGIAPALIREELQNIIGSRHFCHSKRAQQFLQFVVEQKINGNEDSIKERLIGVQIFGRDIDYVTGDDPVVRVQAGEVRRRLELYQADVEDSRPISIELPLGSYVPLFRRRSVSMSSNTATPGSTEEFTLSGEEQSASSFNKKHSSAGSDNIFAPPSANEEVEPKPALAIDAFANKEPKSVRQDTPGEGAYARVFVAFPRRGQRALGLCVCVLLGLFTLAAVTYKIQRRNSPEVLLRDFWSPSSLEGKPVLICVGKPILYQPSLALYRRYAEKHPGAFVSSIERRTTILPLDGEEMLHWNEMEVIRNSGPAIGGVRAAMNVSALLGHLGHPFSVRFGDEASFTDLRESPAVIIGALNNRWLLEISSDLHFSMHDVNGRLFIKEAGPTGRTWGVQQTVGGWRDYGLVTRQIKGATGQFTVKIEGISDNGTQAGSEIISNPEAIKNALAGLPKGWENKNIQLVVSTNVTEGRPGPPQLVAYHIW